jgi:hypothetical protein
MDKNKLPQAKKALGIPASRDKFDPERVKLPQAKKALGIPASRDKFDPERVKLPQAKKALGIPASRDKFDPLHSHPLRTHKSAVLANERNNREKLLFLLAEGLGLEKEDITEDDSLEDDLHLTPSSIFDLLSKLSIPGMDTENLDLSGVETVEQLLDVLEEET